MISPHLLPDGGLLPRRGRAASELLRPCQAQQASVGEQPAELLGDLQVGRIVGEGAEEVGREVLPDQATQLSAERCHTLTHVVLHG